MSEIKVSPIIVSDATVCMEKRPNSFNSTSSELVSNVFCLVVAKIIHYVNDLKGFCNTCQIFLSAVLGLKEV